MVNEAPVQLLGQLTFNYPTVPSLPQMTVIPSGMNTRGIILRNAIIVAISSGGGSTPPMLFADVNLQQSSAPPPPPLGPSATMRAILIANPVSGPAGVTATNAQLLWPLYLEPGLGLGFNTGSAISGISLYGTFDYVS
ncbi:MAG: hypothetical protein ACK4FJ_03010 [Ferrovibrio sp.]|uniref:hypothetical protein n=1 Tax=Ferrovibrio sp. TaxID=1917215 RepID=UPI00391BAF10